ncbi:hypothetical protein LSTR_LSTR012010, partial [Laodelphax striatellus]
MNGCTVITGNAASPAAVVTVDKLATMDEQQLHIRENPLSQVGNTGGASLATAHQRRNVGLLSRRPPIISFFLIIVLMLVILMLGILLLVAVARIECPSKMTLSAMQKAAKPEVCLTESCVRT